MPRKSLAVKFFSWMMSTRRAPRRPNARACLRRAGARQVWVATVARTLKLASNYAEFRLSDGDAGEIQEEDAAMATAAGS